MESPLRALNDECSVALLHFLCSKSRFVTRNLVAHRDPTPSRLDPLNLLYARSLTGSIPCKCGGLEFGVASESIHPANTRPSWLQVLPARQGSTCYEIIGFGVGRGFAISSPFPVQAPDNAPERWTWSTMTENHRFGRWAWVGHLGPLCGARTGQRTGNVDLVNKV